jgi:hypothetical protein
MDSLIHLIVPPGINQYGGDMEIKSFEGMFLLDLINEVKEFINQPKIKLLNISHAANGNINPKYTILVIYEELQ